MTAHPGFTRTYGRTIVISWMIMKEFEYLDLETVLAHEMIHAKMFMEGYDVWWENTSKSFGIKKTMEKEENERGSGK